MKDFIYDTSQGLHTVDCDWLSRMGLRETRWILDSEWILSFFDDMTYHKWTD